MRSKCIWGIEKISKEENYPPSKRILGIEEDVIGSSYPSGKRWQSNFWRREKHKRKSLSVGKKMAREFEASREAQKGETIR